MNRKQFAIFGAVALLTALAPRLNAADAEVKVKADTDRPKAEVSTDLDRNKDRDVSVKTDTTNVSDQDKVRHGNKASGILGMEVRNKQNEKLGEIKDLVMDLPTGKVTYAVLSVGGFLGVGEKLIAVRPESFQYSDSRDHLILDADKGKIQAAPGFAATNWPPVNHPETSKFFDQGIGGAATSESSKSGLTREKRVDLDSKDKIYTDADKDKKVKIEVDKK
jgi:sporulation protein YlmC with PRC-barrel domain